MANSLASIGIEDDLQSNGRDDNSVTSNDPDPDKVVRRKRWTFKLRQREGGQGTTKFKALTVSCRCKGAIKGSCLIISAAFIELLGNLIALLYGVGYILSASGFYDLENDSEIQKNDYDTELQHVLFLEKYRVGFVGLLAISLMGMVVSFMMPIGTIYKSWRCIRTAMSLLFSMCVFHCILVGVYLNDSHLIYTIAALPFRIYELFLLYSYIRYYKKKKLEEIRSGKRKPCLSSEECKRMDKEGLDTASLLSMEQTKLVLGTPEVAGKGSEVQVTFELPDGNQINQTIVVPENAVIDSQSLGLDPGMKVNKKKRARLFGSWKRQEKTEKKHYRIPERWQEYK